MLGSAIALVVNYRDVKLCSDRLEDLAPDVLPTGWQAHAVPMILVNTGLELAAALKTAGRTDQAQRA